MRGLSLLDCIFYQKVHIKINTKGDVRMKAHEYWSVGALITMLAIALFGTTSPAALATTVGVLTEVPVMLALVKVSNSTRGWFKK